MLSADRIEAALASHRAVDLPEDITPKRSAVAALLRYRSEAPEVLLMQRAARPEDRWSGQVSLPGGRAEPQDVSYRGTDTCVEIGKGNTIREGVTINRGSEKEDGVTRLGDDLD